MARISRPSLGADVLSWLPIKYAGLNWPFDMRMYPISAPTPALGTGRAFTTDPLLRAVIGQQLPDAPQPRHEEPQIVLEGVGIAVVAAALVVLALLTVFAIELSDTELPSISLDTFGRPARTTPCECDRNGAPSMSQALDLFNGETLQAKLKSPDGAVAALLKSGKNDREIVEELFLRALARKPSEAELAGVLKVVPQAPSRAEAIWVIAVSWPWPCG